MDSEGTISVSPERAALFNAFAGYHRLAERHLLDMLQRIFASMDEQVVLSGPKAAENSTLYLDAMKELNLERDRIIQTFRDQYLKYFRDNLQEASFDRLLPKETSSGGLSLVDESELEQSLAVDGLIAKIKERFHQELYVLAQRFSHLPAGGLFAEGHHPLSPEPMCYALRDAVQLAAIDLKARLVIYKMFDQHVTQALRSLFDDANGLLTQQGAPDPKKKGAAAAYTRAAVSAPVPSPASGHSGGDGLWQGASAAAGAAQPDVYETLQRLLSQQKYGGVSGGASAEQWGEEVATVLPAYSTDEVLRGLSGLQHSVTGHPGGGDVRGELVNQVRHTAGVPHDKAINPVHDNTIDAVGMIFEFILDDPSVDDSIKMLISRLQIPILKIAILDRNFFSRKMHPARRLLNELAYAGMRWHEKQEEARERLIQKIDSIVMRVLTDFEENAEIFAGLLDEFLAFMEGEQDQEQETEDDAVAVPQEERAEAAIRDAAREIESRLLQHAPPEAVSHFLSNVWQRVLRHAHQSQTDGTDIWQIYLQAADDLIWTAQPKASHHDRLKLVKLLPLLIDTLRAGMEAAGYRPQEIDAAMDELESYHIASIRGQHVHAEIVAGTSGIIPATAATVSRDRVDEMIRSMREQMDATDAILIEDTIGSDPGLDLEDMSSEAMLAEAEQHDEYQELAENMVPGAWFDLTDGDTTRRVKLAWKSNVLGYVFVDRKFKVVAEKTQTEVAAMLREHALVMSGDVGLFDKALDAVVNRLVRVQIAAT